MKSDQSDLETISLEKTADILDLSSRTLARLIAKGEIKTIKLGRRRRSTKSGLSHVSTISDSGY